LILDLDIRKYFRGDAAFAIPELYSFLEAERHLYAIRLKSNAVLERHIQHLLTCPVGRPPKKPVVRYHDFKYQAASWDRERRVVAKVEWYQDALFPRVGFIVTNLSWRSKRVVRFYNQRSTAEQWIKEDKNAIKWTKLSCHDFVDNQVRLQLFALAYNLGNFLRMTGAAKTHEALDDDDPAGKADQDRCEGDGPFAVRVFPDGRGGGAPKAVRRHPGTYPMSAYRGQHGAFMMTRQVVQIGPRRDTSGGCSAPSEKNRIGNPLCHARRGPLQPVRPEKDQWRRMRNAGGAGIMTEHGLAT